MTCTIVLSGDHDTLDALVTFEPTLQPGDENTAAFKAAMLMLEAVKYRSRETEVLIDGQKI